MKPFTDVITGDLGCTVPIPHSISLELSVWHNVLSPLIYLFFPVPPTVCIFPVLFFFFFFLHSCLLPHSLSLTTDVQKKQPVEDCTPKPIQSTGSSQSPVFSSEMSSSSSQSLSLLPPSSSEQLSAEEPLPVFSSTREGKPGQPMTSHSPCSVFKNWLSGEQTFLTMWKQKVNGHSRLKLLLNLTVKSFSKNWWMQSKLFVAVMIVWTDCSFSLSSTGRCRTWLTQECSTETKEHNEIWSSLQSS